MAAANRPPGPKLQPIVGGWRDYQRDPLAYVLHCSRNYDDVVYTHFLGQPFYLLNHPDYVRQVLVEQPDQFRKLNAARRSRSTSLSDSEGAQWQRRRKLIQPAFHHSRVRTYGQTMAAQADALRATATAKRSRFMGQ